MDTMTKEYLIQLMKRCQKYEAFSTYLGTVEDVRNIRLQDVYTVPYILEMEDARVMGAPHTERSIRTQISRTLSVIKSYNAKSEAVHCELPKKKEAHEAAVRYKKIVYASEGGGKTSFLNIYALLCAYTLLGESAVEDRSLERLLLSHNVVSANFEIDGTAVPVFISGAALWNTSLPEKNGLEEVIISEIKNVLGDADLTRAEHIYRQNAIALIIDDLDAMSDNKLEEALVEYLEKEEDKVHTVVLTKGDDTYIEYMEKMKVERYVLPELQYGEVDWIVEFARRWYRIVGDGGERKVDVETDFLLPFTRNAEVLSRIRTPRELTDILMISVYDNCLPSDVISVTKRLLEIKLKKAGLDENDIVPKLAKAAYEMLETGDGYISEKRLKRYVAGENEEVEAFAFDLCFDDEEAMDRAIDAFEESLHVNRKIGRLDAWRIIRWKYVGETGPCYEFVDKEEEAYLVAYAVKHNLVKDKAKETRFDYIKDKIANKDATWRDSIISLAVIDGKLQAEIINELLGLAQEAVNDSYYAEVLLELAKNPEVVFLFAELEKLFEILLKPCNQTLFTKETGKIEHMVLKNSSKENSLFVKMLLKKGELIDDPDQQMNYYFVVNNTIAFGIQQCDPGEVMLEQYPGYIRNKGKIK